MDPMKKLLTEQAVATSDLVTAAMEKHNALSLVLARVTEDAKVQNRRQQDVGHLQMRLEALEDELLEADADAAEACDREDTYTMMDGRLRDLVSDDQARINKIQRVIDESKLRLNQWHGVSKDGEAELGRAEAELAALRAKLKTERHTQRKMMGERRKTVETMVQYTKDRVAREAEHRDQLMASRGDLDAEGEAKLKMAAGTMEALRAMDSNSKVQLSFEEKCRAAFDHIQQLTGASGLPEVLYIITSKKELTDQLQKRVESTEQRIAKLTDERDVAEAQAAEMQYGVNTDSQAKVALEEARVRVGESEARAQRASKQLGEAMTLLQGSRLAWENLLHLLEAGREPSHRTRGVDQFGSGPSAAAGTPASAAAMSEGEAGGGGMSLISSAMLPAELAELPLMLEEVSERAERLLTRTQRREQQQASALGLPESSGGTIEAIRAVGGAAASGEAEDMLMPLGAAEPRPARGKRPSKGGDGGDGKAGGAVRNNIRVLPPEMLEDLVSRDEEDAASRGRTPGSRASARSAESAAAALRQQEEDDDLLSREDLKAVSSRITRKATRRRPGTKEDARA